jgi:hypothetical protein
MNHMSPFGEMSLQGPVARSQSEFVPLWSGSWQWMAQERSLTAAAPARR